MEKIYRRFEFFIFAAIAKNCSQKFFQIRNLNWAYGIVYKFPYLLKINGEKRSFVYFCKKNLCLIWKNLSIREFGYIRST